MKIGRNIISNAEEELRRLLGRAAESGDYDSIIVLTEWARRLRDVLESRAKEPGCHPTAERVPSPGNGDGGGIASDLLPPEPRNGSTGPRGTPVRRKKRAAGLKRRSSSRPSDYPKFLRDGENLVKIGWSKSEKAPYEHRAARRVLGYLVGALQRMGRDRRRFTMDDVLPLKDPEDGTEIPTYQVYLCLAWLRAEKLIVQHGRQGYTLPDPADLHRLCEERIQALPRR